MKLTVGVAQMDIRWDGPDRNRAAAQALAAQAATRGVDLLVLPELWPTGYHLVRAKEDAAPLDEGHFAWMAKLAREHRIYVSGTALEANPEGAPFNTAALYGPEGARAASYRKVHLFPPMGEVQYLSPGAELPVFDLPWGRTALAICYDLRFPEMWRPFADGGAGLVVLSAEWPVQRVEHWRVLLRARAIENQLFVAGCNRAGEDADGVFGGHSAVVDPMGQVLAEGGTEPGLIVAELDLDQVQAVRTRLPFLQDRRPEVYR